VKVLNVQVVQITFKIFILRMAKLQIFTKLVLVFVMLEKITQVFVSACFQIILNNEISF
jgi:hypothetical protein